MKTKIPSYVEEMISVKAAGAIDKCEKLCEFVKNDVVCKFAFVTDIHNCVDYAQRAFYAIDKINEKFKLDFVCLGGDYLCNNINTSRSEALKQHRDLANSLDNLKIKNKTFVMNGNHDSNPFNSKNSLTHEQIYNILMNHHIEKFNINAIDKNSIYGYMDIDCSKIRVIFLDVCEQNTNSFVIGNKQMNWFAHTALDLPGKEWGVLLFSHTLPIPSRLSTERTFGGEAVWEILCAFKNGTKYSAKVSNGDKSYDVECDFTKSGEGEVIAWFVGHNHADRTDVIDSVRVISTLAACSDNMGTGICDDGSFHRKVLGSAEESAFSIVSINRTTRKINYIRCGAGPDFSCGF